MARVNATQLLAKWGTNLVAASPYIKAGVNAVTQSPGVAAAAAQDRMLANLTAAVSSGMWAKRVAAVPLQSWKDAIINKGIPRIAAGVATAQASKVQTFTNLLADVDASVASLASTPRADLETNIGRAATYARAMSAASKARKLNG